MVKIPDSYALGRAPEAAHIRPARIDENAFAAPGRALAQVGERINHETSAWIAEQNEQESARAQLKYEQGIRDFKRDLDSDPNYESHAPRFRDYSETLAKDVTANVGNPKQRERLLNSLQRHSLVQEDQVWRQARTRQGQEEIGKLDQLEFETSRQIQQMSEDDAKDLAKLKSAGSDYDLEGEAQARRLASQERKNELVRAYMESVAGATRMGRGWLSPHQAWQRVQKFGEKLDLNEIDQRRLRGDYDGLVKDLNESLTNRKPNVREILEEDKSPPTRGIRPVSELPRFSGAYSRGFWGDDPTWNQLNGVEKAAAMALLEADAKKGRPDFESARNALGAMINRADKDSEDLGDHVSKKIYQPTIEPAQYARLARVVGSEEWKRLVQLATDRMDGKVDDWTNGATHFLAHPRQMLELEAKNPIKYRSWRGWTGFNSATGEYKNQVMTDASHAFLSPEGIHSAKFRRKAEEPAVSPFYDKEAGPDDVAALVKKGKRVFTVDFSSDKADATAEAVKAAGGQVTAKIKVDDLSTGDGREVLRERLKQIASKTDMVAFDGDMTPEQLREAARLAKEEGVHLVATSNPKAWAKIVHDEPELAPVMAQFKGLSKSEEDRAAAKLIASHDTEVHGGEQGNEKDVKKFAAENPWMKSVVHGDTIVDNSPEWGQRVRLVRDKAQGDNVPFRHLEPGKIRSLISTLERERKQNDAYWKDEIDTSAKDAIAQIEATGKTDIDLTDPKVDRVLGPKQAAAYRRKADAAKKVYDIFSNLPLMTEQQIAEERLKLESDISRENQDILKKLDVRVNEIERLRFEDPARSVKDSWVLQRARTLQTRGEMTPRDIAKASLQAQRIAGVPPELQKPVENAELQKLMAPLVTIPVDAPNNAFNLAVRDIVAKVRENYGEFAPKVLNDARLLFIKGENRSDRADAMDSEIAKAIKSGNLNMSNADWRRNLELGDIDARIQKLNGSDINRQTRRNSTPQPFLKDAAPSQRMKAIESQRVEETKPEKAEPNARQLDWLEKNPDKAAKFKSMFPDFDAEKYLKSKRQ